jgi:hypothetical protein
MERRLPDFPERAAEHRIDRSRQRATASEMPLTAINRKRTIVVARVKHGPSLDVR